MCLTHLEGFPRRNGGLGTRRGAKWAANIVVGLSVLHYSCAGKWYNQLFGCLTNSLTVIC